MKEIIRANKTIGAFVGIALVAAAFNKKTYIYILATYPANLTLLFFSRLQSGIEIEKSRIR